MRKLFVGLLFLSAAAFAGQAALAAVPDFVLVGSGLLDAFRDVGAFLGMAVVQSTYGNRQPVGFPGMVATESTHDIDTRVVEPSSGIPFGRACSQGTADSQVKLGGALADFVGISVRDQTLDPVASDSDYVDEYQQYDSAGILVRGDIWVTATVAVAKNDPVHYNATTGAFVISGGSGPIVGARWMTSAAADGLAIVRLSGHLP